jgi:sulfate transport system permease protein
VVFIYVVSLILSPIVALIVGAFRNGPGAILDALLQPDVLTAFWLTLLISVIVVVVHAIFGTVVAWTFVRDRFPGRKLINGLIDMPFALSPVVIGYMLLLLFGRNGVLAPLLVALDFKVAFALPGMILATLLLPCRLPSVN